MIDPVVDYGLRAGSNPRPDSWVEPVDPRFAFAHTPDEGALYAASGMTFYADIAEFQPVINGAYPYPKFGFRADNGNRVDHNAAANWAYCETHPDRIRVVIPYVVFKPGQMSGVMQRLKDLFGGVCPPQVVPEIDMESGADFAGPGDHSTEANRFAAELAQWAGSQAKVQGYANAPDWQACWPTRPAWLKRRLAAYNVNPVPAGYYSQQYYGALPYPSPPGYPRTCAPFGSYVDMNVTPRTITQIEADYGVAAPTPAPKVRGDDDMELWLLKNTSSGLWLAGGRAITSNVNTARAEFIAQGGKTYTISDEAEFNRIKNSYLIA